MRVAKGDRKGVCGVGRFGIAGEPEGRAYHLLNLLFGSAAVTCDRHFHFAWRITVRRNLRLRCRKQHHSANLGQLQRGSNVQSCEYGFHCNSVGRKLFHKARNQLMNIAEPRVE